MNIGGGKREQYKGNINGGAKEVERYRGSAGDQRLERRRGRGAVKMRKIANEGKRHN